MTDFSAYIDSNMDRFRSELSEFLEIPSISTDRQRREDVRRCAEFVAENAREAGLDEVEVVATEGHPIVVAAHEADPDAPTLLIYGHYDVQPVDPEHLWTTPPFQPDVRDGRIYARGSTDDKGQVHMHLKALEARLAGGSELPVNVKLVIEGEEEIGSRNLESFLREHRDRLACDAVVISDTTMLAADKPCITMGLRGISYMQVTLTGPGTDLHSGSYGGAVVNPANALAEIIAKLKDSEGRVTIPRFYEAVRPLHEDQREALRKLPFDEEDFRKEIDAPALGGESGFSTLERLWYRPTLDVNGLLSGFTGEGAKTVLPSSAMAKISMRLVPDQESEEITRRFTEYVKAITPAGVRVEIESFHGGEPWAADPDAPVFTAAAEALKGAFGAPPFFIREGGSIPIVPMFEEVFRGPVLLLGFGLPGSNPHAPNEWLDLDVYQKGIGALAVLYDEVAARGV